LTNRTGKPGTSIPFVHVFPPGIPGKFRLNGSPFRNSTISGFLVNFPKKIPLPVSKFSKFLVDWKARKISSLAESLLSVHTGPNESGGLILAFSLVVEIQPVNSLCSDHSAILQNYLAEVNKKNC